MTTKPETPMVRMSGTIQDWAKKQGRNGEFIQIKLMVEGNRYPTTISDFSDLLASAKKGQHITLDVTEQKGEYDGKPVTYRNVARVITDAVVAPSEPSQQPAKPATVPAVAPAHSSGGNDTQRASIEAQVAAKIASEILRDMLTTVNEIPEAKMPLVRKLLPELTMIARAAIHEASQG